MKTIDTILRAQKLLAAVHDEASKLWLMTRDTGAGVVSHSCREIDDQFGEVVSDIVDLRAVLESMIEAQLRDPEEPPANLELITHNGGRET